MAKGTIGGVVQFNRRVAPPGTRFFYASVEREVLGLVLRNAVGRTVSGYSLPQPLPQGEGSFCFLLLGHGLAADPR